MPTYHRIKIFPCYFRRVITGEKTFEIRYNDRGYKQGDYVTLCEWKMKNGDPRTGRYTGREATYRIGTVIPDMYGGYVVFSLLGANKK